MRFSIGVFAIAIACSSAAAQTPLTAYTDANGFLDVQRLTCAQLAGTFQEDADIQGSNHCYEKSVRRGGPCA